MVAAANAALLDDAEFQRRSPVRALAVQHADAPAAVGYGRLLTLANMPVLLAIIFAVTFVERSVGPVLALYLEETGVPADRVIVIAGWLFSLTAVAGAIGHHVCSYLLQRYAPRQVMVAAVGVAAAGAGVYALGAGPWSLSVAATSLGLGSGVATTAAYAMAGDVIPAGARGVGFGMLTGSALVGLAASPVVAGLLAATTLRGVFILDVLLIAGVALGIQRWMREAIPS